MLAIVERYISLDTNDNKRSFINRLNGMIVFVQVPVKSIGTQRIKHKRAVFVGECIEQSD